MEDKNTRLTIKNIGERMLDYNVREKAFIFIEGLITIVLAIAATIINFVAGEYNLGYITLGFSIVMLAFLVIEYMVFTYKSEVPNSPFLYVNIGCTYALVILYLIFAPQNGLYFYWIVSFPTIMVIVCGVKKGLLFSLALLVISILFFFVPPFHSWMMGTAPTSEKDFSTFRIFFILNYLMTMLIGVAVASVNDRIIKKLNVLKEDYYRDANTDITTGLRNQLYFISYVRRLSKEVEVGESIGFMFIDVDDFKMFNDKYGHSVGNQILIKVANKLNEVPHDLLVRWGGDEFAIVERNITRDEFIAKAHYLLKGVEGLPEKVTISIGLAYYTVDEEFDFDKLFNEADMKTIRAKGKGKNCVVIND